MWMCACILGDMCRLIHRYYLNDVPYATFVRCFMFTKNFHTNMICSSQKPCKAGKIWITPMLARKTTQMVLSTVIWTWFFPKYNIFFYSIMWHMLKLRTHRGNRWITKYVQTQLKACLSNMVNGTKLTFCLDMSIFFTGFHLPLNHFLIGITQSVTYLREILCSV